MPWEAWVTLGVIALMAVALLRNMAGPDVILLGGMTLLMTLHAVSDRFPAPRDAVEGFGNAALATIAALFVVAEGLRQTGAMTMITAPLLGRPTRTAAAQARLMAPVIALSAFMNNTPIVAMFMPVVADWCRKHNLSPAKLFIPLSYAAILGGVCTLIGTSTNLVVYGMLDDAQRQHFGMFTLSRIGLPVAAVGVAYVLLASPKLLRDRAPRRRDLDDPRQFTVEMLVEPGSPIDGRTIGQAGLRHLPGVYLMEIERGEERIVAVGPEQVLRGDDRLIFVGVVDSVVDLQKIRGLMPATDQVFKLSDPRPERRMVEAVVSDACPIVGKSIREGRFRTTYNAVVIAVHRGGERLTGQKIGDIVLQPGDTLLLETHPRFVDNQRNRRDFYLTSAVPDSTIPRHDKAWLALGILVALVLVVQLGWLTLMPAALWAAGLMVLTRCCSAGEARAAIDWRVLLVIGAALAIGASMDSTGAAKSIADAMIGLVQPMGVIGMLLGIHLIAMLFTETIGHVGAAALVYPIALETARDAGIDPASPRFVPFIVVIMVAASASFATPTGYQTNLMVFGPGGYRFSDYVRFGLPLNLLVMIVTVLLAAVMW